jgi:hypothetical protein
MLCKQDVKLSPAPWPVRIWKICLPSAMTSVKLLSHMKITEESESSFSSRCTIKRSDSASVQYLGGFG